MFINRFSRSCDLLEEVEEVFDVMEIPLETAIADVSDVN